MLERSGAAARDDVDLHAGRNGAEELDVEPGARAVAVHRGEEDLAGAEALGFDAPVGGVHARRLFSAPDHRLAVFRIARENDRLDAELARAVGDELRIAERRRVDRDAVGAGAKHRAEVFDRAHAAADGQRDEERFGGAADGLERRLPAVIGGGDVEDHQLIGAFRFVAFRALDGIARVADVEEVHSFDHAAVADVEAGDDALRNRVRRRRSCPRFGEIDLAVE